MAKLTKEFVEATLELADKGQSKISERERELFGISSPRLKALLNNLCSKEDTKYLELGVYKGSTIISAVYGNKTCKAVGVENYKYDEREPKRHAPEGQIWENMKSQLKANLDRYSDPGVPVDVSNITIVEGNFQEVDLSKHGKFDICFFDIVPATTDTYVSFFEKIVPVLSSEAVILFSNYSNVHNAKELDFLLADNSDKFDIQWKTQRISGGLSDYTQYHSGLLIVGIKKKIAKINKAAT